MALVFRLLFCIFLLSITSSSFAQLDALFAPFDCREHVTWHQGDIVIAEEPKITIDSSLLIVEVETPVFDTIDGWKDWRVVENFSFGKDRGSLTMITDLQALHPYFRDRITHLIALCKKKGIELAVVETFRTHAKQNEYKFMGRNYTNSAGGRSKHQYGLACDVVPMINGRPVWDNAILWKKVGTLGESLGLRWGGRWKKPYDPAHFEWTGGLTSYQLSAGQLPPIPVEHYPCIEEDIDVLRRYWKQWETVQSSITRK